MLVLHIILAVLSLVWATITYIKPSLTKLRASYWLINSVVLSGVLLVVFNHAVIMQACTSGLVYLAVSLSATIITRRKLAMELLK